MSTRSTDLRMLIEAFGAPADAEARADESLFFILDALCDDAAGLPDGDETIRLECKLRALCGFVEKYLTISWSEDAVAPAQTEASETQNTTPPVGKNELN